MKQSKTMIKYKKTISQYETVTELDGYKVRYLQNETVTWWDSDRMRQRHNKTVTQWDSDWIMYIVDSDRMSLGNK